MIFNSNNNCPSELTKKMHLCIKNENTLGLNLFPELSVSALLTEKQHNDIRANTQQASHGSVELHITGTVLFYFSNYFFQCLST